MFGGYLVTLFVYSEGKKFLTQPLTPLAPEGCKGRCQKEDPPSRGPANEGHADS